MGLRVGVSKTRRPPQLPVTNAKTHSGQPRLQYPSSFKGPTSTQRCEFLFFLFSPPCHCESLSPSPQIYFLLLFTTNHLLSIPNNTYVLLSNSSTLKPPLSHETKQNGVCLLLCIFLISQTFRCKAPGSFLHRHHPNHHRRRYPPNFSSSTVMKSIGGVCGD